MLLPFLCCLGSPKLFESLIPSFLSFLSSVNRRLPLNIGSVLSGLQFFKFSEVWFVNMVNVVSYFIRHYSSPSISASLAL